MDAKIDHAVPMPDVGRSLGRTPKWPWKELQPGDSFFVPKRKMVSTRYWQKVTGFEFVTRKAVQDGVSGVRIWRLA